MQGKSPPHCAVSPAPRALSLISFLPPEDAAGASQALLSPSGPAVSEGSPHPLQGPPSFPAPSYLPQGWQAQGRAGSEKGPPGPPSCCPMNSEFYLGCSCSCRSPQGLPGPVDLVGAGRVSLGAWATTSPPALRSIQGAFHSFPSHPHPRPILRSSCLCFPASAWSTTPPGFALKTPCRESRLRGRASGPPQALPLGHPQASALRLCRNPWVAAGGQRGNGFLKSS